MEILRCRCSEPRWAKHCHLEMLLSSLTPTKLGSRLRLGRASSLQAQLRLTQLSSTLYQHSSVRSTDHHWAMAEKASESGHNVMHGAIQTRTDSD